MSVALSITNKFKDMHMHVIRIIDEIKVNTTLVHMERIHVIAMEISTVMSLYSGNLSQDSREVILQGVV